MDKPETTPRVRPLEIIRALLFVPTWLVVSVVVWLGVVAAVPGSMDEVSPAIVLAMLAGSALVVLVLGWLLVRRRRGGFLAGWAIALVALASAWAAMHLTAKAEYEREVEQWKAVGGVVDYAELRPAPVPDDQNAAIVYRAALATVARSTADVEGLDKLLRDPWDAEDLANVVESQSRTLELMHEAGARPGCDWEGLDGEAPDTLDARSYIRPGGLLVVQAIVRARSGDLSAAADSILAGLRYASALTVDRSLEKHLLRGAVEHMMLTAYERLFSDTDQRAPRIEEALARLDHQVLSRRMLMAEPAKALERLGGMEKVNALQPLAMAMTFATGQMSDGLAPWIFVPGNVHRDMAVYLRWYRQFVEVCSQPFHKQDETQLPTPRELPVYAVLARQQIAVGMIDGQSAETARIEARTQMGILAGRLRAHKLEHGQYPETLDAIGKAPVDPWNGKPFGYTRDGDGFVLISGAPRDVKQQEPLSWRWVK